MSIQAKSVVFDFLDSQDIGYLGMGVRSIDFYLNGSLVSLGYLDFTSYYSSVQNVTYYDAKFAFNTGLSKTGTATSRSWLSNFTNDPQRIIIVFNSIKYFDQIKINNYHEYGLATNKGIKNTKITITDAVYSTTTAGASVTNGTLIWEDTINAHITSDVVDSQEIDLFNEVSFSLLSMDFDGLVWYGDSHVMPTMPLISPSIEATFHTPGLITTWPQLSPTITGTFTPRIVDLVFDLPSLSLDGTLTANKIDLSFEIPAFNGIFYSGSMISSKLPKLNFSGNLRSDINGDIIVKVPLLNAIFNSGAQITTEFPGLDIVMVGESKNVSNVAVNFPRFGVSLTSSGSLLNTVNLVMPKMFAVVTGSPGIISTVALTWPMIRSDIIGLVENEAALAFLLPRLDCDLTGDSSVRSTITLILPGFDVLINTNNAVEQILRHERNKVR